jgi:UDP-N-acetylmuramate-alanine ligase
MPFIGIISKENDSNYIKNIINKNAIKSKFEVININKKSIENIKNIKFDILVICENIEKMLKESSYLEDIIKKSYYLVINSDIKENFSLLKDIEANIITYGFNAKSTITISSIKDDKLMLCLQRSIKGIFSIIEEQEFNIEIKRNNVNKLYNILVIFAILAIYGEILQKI